MSLWRDGDCEIDLLVRRSDERGLAIEIKSGLVKDLTDTTVKKFKTRFPKIEIIIASMLDEHPRRLPSGTMVLPWKTALERMREFE